MDVGADRGRSFQEEEIRAQHGPVPPRTETTPERLFRAFVTPAGELLRWTDRFDDPNLPGEMTTTARLKNPDAIPAEACVLGWQESLTLLAQLVEAKIPD